MLDVLVTTNRISQDPDGRDLISYLRNNSEPLGINDGALYYDFPTYSDYDTVAHKPDALLVSKLHGILAIRFLKTKNLSASTIQSIDESLTQFCSILIGRLLKSPVLRRNLSQLRFNVEPVLFASNLPQDGLPELDSSVITSQGNLANLLHESRITPLEADALAEMRSVIEGAKALSRPKKRIIENPEKQHFAVALGRLEAEIANFDQRQRRAALIAISGPQRIRGLAGSGKTVILAMKAAYLHMTNPDANIVITYFTRSLRTALQTMITRFYRHYKDEDPDWGKVHIRHGWGRTNLPGVYSDACRRNNQVPLTFTTARAAAKPGIEPFDHACRTLLASQKVAPYYDYILIDEGQDFPSSFYELCYALAKGERDSKNIVWAYDELQNILDVKIRSPEELFGKDADGEPRVLLERSRGALPPGGENDAVLSKCYRNQREVLVTSHALGFGIYGEIVQLLESKEHWQDVGYEVLTQGDLQIGSPVDIFRPKENSPLSLEGVTINSLIEFRVFNSVPDEVQWVAEQIGAFISGGLQPDEIIVIALDDRNAKAYLRSVSGALAQLDIASNNIVADPYTEPPFQISGKVTLSTVYRAKGNEASAIFAMGVDAISLKSRLGRNRLFTAFTRTKAWLRISGFGANANAVNQELNKAKENFPYLKFVMPDLQKIDLIQRDLGKKTAKAKKIRDDLMKRLRKEGFTDEDISDFFAGEARDAKV